MQSKRQVKAKSRQRYMPARISKGKRKEKVGVESKVTAEVKKATQNGGKAKVNMQSKCRSACQVKAQVKTKAKTKRMGKLTQGKQSTGRGGAREAKST